MCCYSSMESWVDDVVVSWVGMFAAAALLVFVDVVKIKGRECG